ncbi:MAG TPA: trehalase-like domain-containing protein, partial [Cytophagales bacterium]|nr:trehalase-like domain-containing protein [Cytophagales bacterium]
MAEIKLSEYALIGNSRSAALVSHNGSIDWCCIPEFDSSSIFASILDSRKGGFFSIAPVPPFRSVQSYLSETNVAETYFTTDEGEVRLWDAFTVMDEEEKTRALFPDHEILRIIEGVSGTVRVKFEYMPKTFYGKNTPHLRDSKKLGINFSWKGHYFNLLTTLPPSMISISDERSMAQAEFEVKKGERVIFSLSYSNQGPAVLPELHATGYKRMLNTINFWKNWLDKCTYDGLYKEHVKRSALALKLLTYA